MKVTKKNQRKDVIGLCQEIIKSFNPKTHSIDSHCFEKLGDTSKPVI